MERKFTEYLAEIGEGEYEIQYPSTDDAHSKAHKIFVRGSILFSAVDGDLDGYIGAESGADQTTVNKGEFDYDSEAESGEAAVEDRHDFAYYYLDDARGRVMALLARDVEDGVTHPNTEGGPEPTEANLSRILEYYTYNAFGTVIALPVQDRAEAAHPGVNGSGWFDATGPYPGSGSLGQWDRMEDTPLDLSDNAQLMLNRRNGDNNHVASGQSYGRESSWANEMRNSHRRTMDELGMQFQQAGGYPSNGGRYMGPPTPEEQEAERRRERQLPSPVFPGVPVPEPSENASIGGCRIRFTHDFFIPDEWVDAPTAFILVGYGPRTGGRFRGDNRGFVDDPGKAEDQSRVWATLWVGLCGGIGDNGYTKTGLTLYEGTFVTVETVWVSAGFAGIGFYAPVLTLATASVSGRADAAKAATRSREDGMCGGSFSIKLHASDPIVVGAPEVESEFKGTISVSGSKATIKWEMHTDDFPNFEAFINNSRVAEWSGVDAGNGPWSMIGGATLRKSGTTVVDCECDKCP